MLSSAVISKTNHIRQHSRFYQISPYMVNIILHENNIKMDKKDISLLCATILLRILSLSLSLSPFHSPCHLDIRLSTKFYDIRLSSISFDKTSNAKTPFPSTFPYFFPISSQKLFPLSQQKNFLMKLDTSDFEPSPSSCYTCILSIILSISLFAYK